MPFNMNPQQMAMMRQRAGEVMQRFRGRPNSQPGMPGPGQANTMPVTNPPTMTTQPAPMPQRTVGLNPPTMNIQPAPMPQRTGGVGQFTTQPAAMPTKMANGGSVKGYAKGGSVSGASRGDGCAQRGKTKGRMV